MEFLVRHLNELPSDAKRLMAKFQGEKIFLFEGIMGAGKTTLIKAICQELGVIETVSSPTYSIVNEYVYPQGKIFHFDFFRIKTEIEAYDLGFEEYLYSGHYCFIEWPDKVQSVLPLSYIKVDILQTDENIRVIYASKIETIF